MWPFLTAASHISLEMFSEGECSKKERWFEKPSKKWFMATETQ